MASCLLMTPSGNPQLRFVKREIEVAAEREPYAGFVEHCATPSMWRVLYRSAILFSNSSPHSGRVGRQPIE